MDKKSEEFWRTQLSALRGPLPEVGTDPPMEEIQVEPEDDFKATNGIDPQSIGNFSKVTMDIYFFMDTESNRYFMMQSQSMTDFGEMSLQKAAEMVKRKQKRNKG